MSDAAFATADETATQPGPSYLAGLLARIQGVTIPDDFYKCFEPDKRQGIEEELRRLLEDAKPLGHMTDTMKRLWISGHICHREERDTRRQIVKDTVRGIGEMLEGVHEDIVGAQNQFALQIARTEELSELVALLGHLFSSEVRHAFPASDGMDVVVGPGFVLHTRRTPEAEEHSLGALFAELVKQHGG
jgi:hypothetical protein